MLNTSTDKSYLNDETRIKLINDYLLHEYKKLSFQSTVDKQKNLETLMKNQGTKEKDILSTFINSSTPKKIIETLSIEELWLLFHSVSHCLYKKDLWNCVGLPEFVWEFVRINIRDCVLETPVGWAQPIFPRNIPFTTLLTYAKSHIEMIQGRDNYDKYSQVDRSIDPIIGRVIKEGIFIHDGNGRLVKIAYCIAVNKQEITTLMGYIGTSINNVSQRDKEALDKLKKWLKIMDPLTSSKK
jgi:hypothetical protein